MRLFEEQDRVFQGKELTQNGRSITVRAVETCAQSVCNASTTHHTRIRTAALGVLAVLFWVGCGTVEQCPQGTQEAGDQCLLNSMDNEPKFLESTDVETVPTDAQADGDSIDDSWDDTTSEEVDSTSAVNFTAITQHRAPFWCDRQATGSVPLHTQLNTSGRSEGQAGLGGTSEPFNYESNPRSGPGWARWRAVQKNSLGEALDGSDGTHAVSNRAGTLAGRTGNNNDQENADQCGRGRESRRDCRGWAVGQPRTRNPIQGTT